MKILIIAKAFAPDSVIGAVRINKFAEYLTNFGHDVSVICSSKISMAKDESLLNPLKEVNIVRYDSKTESNRASITISKNTTLNNNLLNRIKGRVNRTIRYYKEASSESKQIINTYNCHNELQDFDVLISTFSPLACIIAANSIIKKSNKSWIIDLRDLMDNHVYPFEMRLGNSFYQRVFLNKCSAVICTSNNSSNYLKHKYPRIKDRVFTVFNGYSPNKNINIENKEVDKEVLNIVYTGSLYDGRRSIKPLFSAIKRITDEYPNFKVIFHYAGGEGKEAIKQSEEVGLYNIVKDYGQLSRSQAAFIQSQADLFLVISWNSKHEKGVIPGKLYEAIACSKPVVGLISGNVANSELKTIIENYSIGICFEEATKDVDQLQLYDYLVSQCISKREKGIIIYNPNKEVFDYFSHENQIHILERVVTSLT